MSKIFLQKLRIAASDADDLLTSCDASDLLDGLEVSRDFMFEAANEIEQLESRLVQVERERDAAVDDLNESADCNCCKHYHEKITSESACFGCDLRAHDHFEWRGVTEANSK